MDVLTGEQRRLNMSRIRSKDTKPEMLVRRGLHRRGLRFRLHDRNLPGTPDLVLPRYRTVIMVQGCFWHGHDCPGSRVPSTRPEFWKSKIARTRERDLTGKGLLTAAGWRALEIWECELHRAADREARLDALAASIRRGTSTG